MEVRCSRCATDYVFDGSRVGPRGVSVKCAACGHVFRVYRPDEGPRQWQVRHADGRRVEFKELTTLQRWIVEGRIRRDHEISRDGGTWKPLGEIKELAPFFEIVERAERAERTSNDLLSAPVAPMSSERSSSLRSHIYSPADLEPVREAARREGERPDTEPDGAPPRPPSQIGPPRFPVSIPDEITGDPPPVVPRYGGFFAALMVLVLVAGAALAWWSGRLTGAPEPSSLMASADPAPVPPSPPAEPAVAARRTDAVALSPPARAPMAAGEPAPEPESEPPPRAGSPPTEPALRRASGGTTPDLLAAGRRALEDEVWLDALDAFGRASELAPARPEPHAGKGAAYLGLGRADLALNAYRTALRLDPDYVSARLGVGRALLATGDEAGARRAIRTFLKRAPANHPERPAAQALLEPRR